MCTRGFILRSVLNHKNVVKTFAKNYSSAVHTLKVAEQIKKRREAALLGGGQKRIDAQHKKVANSNRISVLTLKLKENIFLGCVADKQQLR